MNKKLKRMLATVSAVVVCAVSAVSMTSGAIYIENSAHVTLDTVSFSMGDKKYGVWQEMNDYFDDSSMKFFISEDGSSDILLINDNIHLGWGWYGYFFNNEEDKEDIEVLKNYLDDNGIEYEEEIMNTITRIDPLRKSFTDYDEYFQFIKKTKEDTGFIQDIVIPETLVCVNVTDVVNELPEPTLLGDTDCDGKVNINDAVFVMQSIANPDKYQLSEQGKANADIDGNGLTLSDAVTIQEMAASHLCD